MNTPAPSSAAGGSGGPDPGFACVAAAWSAHQGELRAWLRHRLADAAAADDVLQDVFVKAMRQQSAFCSLANRRAWLFQVARNAVIDRARTAHPTEPIEQHEEQLPASVTEAPAPVDDLAACLESALDRLSPQDAAILRACDIERQSQRDFAAANDLGLAAAKSRLLRARQRLREHLVRACGVRFDADGTVCCHAVSVSNAAPKPAGG